VARVMQLEECQRCGYGALVPGGVYCANLGVLAMGFGDDGHGVVIPTGGLKIRRV
jgi:hypothetical protein